MPEFYQNLVFAFITGVAGWFFIELLFGPWRSFRRIREEACMVVYFTANVSSEPASDLVDANRAAQLMAQQDEAIRTLRTVAAKLSAYCYNHPFFVRWCLEATCYKPKAAVGGLTGLSNNFGAVGVSSHFHKRQIEEGLKLPENSI